MNAPPRNIRALGSEGLIELDWDDGRSYRLPMRFLRGQCPCASCVDEVTGVRTLDVDSLPDDIRATNIDFCGNYALRLTWTDGHNTGLYTWSYLQELCDSRHTDTANDT